ncbi:MAG: hypothetical protein CVV23_15895 [Ignavibacteriae bacterium HGW-Ignavibacteriae-2]|jgi:hypothetical protein|nr:MAG: hypothetical protein CVV23_15895 [Ignavibacteriae bacterium HGW-Ignavibacteriae-2]
MRSFLKSKLYILALLLFLVPSLIFSSNGTIILKNGKVVQGEIVKEVASHLVVKTDLGEIRIERTKIEKIIYENISNSISDSTSLNSDGLKDRVVVHYQNGDALDGILIAKSPTVILLQTEVGNLAIPKQDVKRLEYISKEFSERGETAIIELTSGATFEGFLYYEDAASLTIITKLGKLTIDKNDLRGIEYINKELDDIKNVEASLLTQKETGVTFKEGLGTRTDILHLGYSPDLGSSFSTGYGVGYKSRFPLDRMEFISLYASTGLGLNVYSLDEANIQAEQGNANVSATGFAMVVSASVGVPIFLNPKSESSYQFYIAPALEANFVYRNLKKEFPSFPSLNSEIKESEFKFGIANEFGMDWNFSGFQVGISYNIHFVFSGDSFNEFKVNFIKTLF